MKAYYIDPILQFVAEVEFIPESNLHGFRRIYEWIDATTFDCVNLNTYGDGMYIDDEGLLKESNYFFKVPIWNGEDYVQRMYCGKALILGVDSDGDSDDVKGLPFKLLQDRIEFLGERKIQQ